MITLAQYVGLHIRSPDWTEARAANACYLLDCVNALLADLHAGGLDFPINPHTQSQVSGETFGGFRPQSCAIGSPDSSHKQGQGIDLYDPRNELDIWISKNPELLVKHGLYREHPTATNTWLHLTTRSPASGRRTFYP